jgi:integrase
MTAKVSHTHAIVTNDDNHALATSELFARARAYADASKSASTRHSYASDFADFAAFCQTQGFQSLPATPQAVALYVSGLADRLKVATIQRRIVAISQAHKEHGLESPTSHAAVRAILQGVRRTLGTAQRQKTPLTFDLVKAALLEIPGDGLKAKRDRAVILLGFAGAFRRAELASLNVGDVRFVKEGAIVTIRRSKTDQTSEGREIAIPALKAEGVCAVHALRQWIAAAQVNEGPLFRSFSIAGEPQVTRIGGRDVARLVQRLARKANIIGDFGGHSLRAGFVTSAASSKGVREADIARVTGHRSVAILRRYVRKANLFEDTPLTAIGRGAR